MPHRSRLEAHSIADANGRNPSDRGSDPSAFDAYGIPPLPVSSSERGSDTSPPRDVPTGETTILDDSGRIQSDGSLLLNRRSFANQTGHHPNHLSIPNSSNPHISTNNNPSEAKDAVEKFFTNTPSQSAALLDASPPAFTTTTSGNAYSFTKYFDSVSNLANVEHPGKYGLIIQTMLVAFAIAVLKLCLVRYSKLETGYATLSDISLIFTGMFFISGVLLSQVAGDLKEAEKMPTEFAGYLEQLEDLFYVYTKHDERLMTKAHLKLLHIAQAWRESLHERPESIATLYTLFFDACDYIRDLDKSSSSMVVNGFVVIGNLRRIAHRGSMLSRTDVIPAAHGLVRFFVFGCTILLFFVKYSNEVIQMMMMICLYTVMWFVVRVVSSFDDPFEDEVLFGMQPLLGTSRLVQHFCFEELALRILKRYSHAKGFLPLENASRIVARIKDDARVADTPFASLERDDLVDIERVEQLLAQGENLKAAVHVFEKLDHMHQFHLDHNIEGDVMNAYEALGVVTNVLIAQDTMRHDRSRSTTEAIKKM